MKNIPAGNGSGTSSPELGDIVPFAFEPVCRNPGNPAEPCPLCDGRGVYMLDVPVNDARHGKFQRCPNYPVEEDRAMQERLRRFGNLRAHRGKTFANFVTALEGRNYARRELESLARAKRIGQSFAAQPKGWVVFEGPYGCGKTHLALAIANERLEQFGEQVLFVTAPDLLDLLRMTYSPAAEASFDEYFEHVRHVPLLVLDDLGVENPSAWAREKLFQLLNTRHFKALPTVITTNVAFDELDPRISSRMLERDIVTHIKISAPDFRRTPRSQSQDMRATDLQLYQHMRFETFDTESTLKSEAATLQRGLDIARSWAARPEKWLCFLGVSGCGKTHLAAAIANDLWERGADMLLFTVPDLLDRLRLAFGPSSNARFDKRFQDILNIPILILDDLRLESATPWAKEKLMQIIDYRYLRRMPTVITTSETMESTDPRLATRLMDRRVCTPFALKAPSYTKRKHPKR